MNRLGASASRALQKITRGLDGGGTAARPVQRPVVLEAVKVRDPVDAVDRTIVNRLSPDQEQRYQRTRGLAVLGEGADARPAWDGCTGCYELKLALDEDVKHGRVHLAYQQLCSKCGSLWAISTSTR